MKKFLFILFSFCLFYSSGKLFSQIDIDYSNTHQVIEGFGGFGPKEVWWANTSQYYDEEFLDLIVNDLGVNIVRTQLYWDFEPENDNEDPHSIDWSGFNFSEISNNGKQFNFMRDLDKIPGMKQIASIWTPPVWMKLDVDNSLASFCNGQCGGYLNPALYEEFAEYCVAYVKTIKRETGVDLYALSLQNELLFANPFESCVYTPEQYAEVLKVVGERFHEEGLQTKIFGPEHMGSYSWNTELFEAVLDDPEARKYLDIYAVHGYQDGVNPSTGTATGWVNMDQRVREYGKQLWMTETSGGEGNWDSDFDMGYTLMLSLKYGKINAWVYWYLSGRVIIDNVPQKRYFIFKNFYKYIRPGAIMVECTSEDPDIIPVAFRNEKEGMLTVVLMNNSDNAKIAPLNFEMPEFVKFFRTSQNENFTEVHPLNNGEIELPAHSFTTMIAPTANKAPTIDSPDDLTLLAEEGKVEIPLSNITNGGDTVSQVSSVEFEFMDPSFVNNPEIILYIENDSALLQFETIPEYYGETRVKVKVLESHNTVNGGINAFKTVSFTLKVLPYINKPPTVNPVTGNFIYERLSGDRFITLTGISDGNLNDGREKLSFTIEALQDRCKFLAVEYNQGEDTARVKLNPRTEGEDTLRITVKDDFGTDLGGKDETTILIPVTITPRSTGLGENPAERIRVFPNPANDVIRISNPEEEIIEEISVIDNSGRCLLTESYSDRHSGIEFDVSEIGPGAFYLLIRTANAELKKLLIKH
jgi:O-glycosyl hydrolase